MPTTVIQDGKVHASPKQAATSKRTQACLVDDYEESKKLYKAEFGTTKGFAPAWESKEMRENLYQEEVVELSKIVDPKTGKHLKWPEMLHKKEDKRVLKNKAFSIVRTKEGWCVLTFMMNGGKHVYLGSTKPEHKQFAVSRIQQMIMEEIK